MSNLQNEIIRTLGVKSVIDPQEEIRSRIDFLKEYCKKTHSNGFVLGISGGQDSTLAGRLASLAVKELREEGYEATFTAIRLPSGVQADEDDAQIAMDYIDPDNRLTYNIFAPVEAFAKQYEFSAQSTLSDFHKGNVKARIRMITQYAVGGEHKLLVIGSDHAAESVTGFFTKFGDGGADILPLNGLTKRQGKVLLQVLQAPERLIEKVPTADLLDDAPLQTDEKELGLSYDDIDDYLEGKAIDIHIAKQIEERYLLTQHKRHLPVTPSDSWWK